MDISDITQSTPIANEDTALTAAKKTSAVLDEITKTAERWNLLKTGALCGVTGGTLGLGFILGGFWWLPAFISIPIILFRLYCFYETRHVRSARRWIEMLDLIRVKKEGIRKSKSMTEDEKNLCYQLLDEFLLFSHPMNSKIPKILD